MVTLARRIGPEGGAILVVLAAVVIANLPYLLGVFDPDPIGPRSGLVSSTTPGVLIGQPTIDPNTGFVSQALGHRAVLDWLHGSVPWWDPYEGVGAPLAGEMQSAAFFPLTALLRLFNGQLYEHILLEMLAGVGMFLVVRRLGAARWASAVGGIAFALNGTFAWFSHAPANPIAFLPFVVLGLELAYSASEQRRRGGWWLISVALALSIYAGFPETAYIDGLLAAGWFVWRLVCSAPGARRAFVAKSVMGLAVGALLAAPVVVAFADYLSHGNTGAHATGLGSVHLPPGALPQLLLPYVYGPIFGFTDATSSVTVIWSNVGGFLTTSLVLLACLGLAAPGRRGLRLVLAIWLVLALAHVFGGPPGLSAALGLVPGMNSVAFYRYSYAAIEFAVIVLAVLGLHELGASPSARRVAGAALAAVALVAAAAFGARPLEQGLVGPENHRVWAWAAVLWGIGLALVPAAAVLLRDRRWRIAASCCLVTLDVLVMFMLPELSAPRRVETDYSPVVYLQHNLGLGRFFTLGPIQPDYGAFFGIASINDNDVPVPSLWTSYVHRRLDPYVDPLVFVGNGGARSPADPPTEQELVSHLDGYRAAGVGYVIAPAGRPLPQSPSTFKLVFASATSLIYHLAGAAPYFGTSNPRCSVKPGGRQSVTVSCPSATVLVRRELFMPGWSAQIHGHKASIHEYQQLFQSVPVAAGTHTVTFAFTPAHGRWALVAFAAGIALLFWGVGIGSLMLQRSRSAVSASATDPHLPT